MPSLHDKLWGRHPAVRKGDQLTLGERAADHMKAVLATWPALILVLATIAAWILTNGFGSDLSPFILLNLCLSCFAAVQCFVLLISGKRGEQVAAEVALHTLDNTKAIKDLLQQNTKLTEQVHKLTLKLSKDAPSA